MFTANMGQKSVLIVEDDFIIGHLIEVSLQQAGYETHGPVARANDAIALCAELAPSHAILDIHLAEGDGIAVAERLRETTGTRVLFATAYCRSLGELISRFGPVVCLEKPYDPAQLPFALDLVDRIEAGDVVTDKLPRNLLVVPAA